MRHGLHPTGLAIDPDVVGPTRLVLEGAVEVATSHDVRDTLWVFRARDLLGRCSERRQTSGIAADPSPVLTRLSLDDSTSTDMNDVPAIVPELDVSDLAASRRFVGLTNLFHWCAQ